VIDSKRSRTAQGVAAERAVLAQMGVLADPFARGMLTAAMALASALACRSRLLQERSVTLAGLAARVLWFDARVTDALDAGIEQVAIIGAGYDSRAWRLQRDRVQFFELDSPRTQHDKVRRAPGPGPIYVEADLRSDDAIDALSSEGLQPLRPVLFVVEGVTMYLKEDIVRSQISQMAKSSSAGSRLAVDFLPPALADTATDRRQRRLQRITRAGSGETFRLLVDGPQASDLVASAGWRVNEVTTMREAACALSLPPAVHLRVESVSDRKTLIAAETPATSPTT
jgi:methyltransferase (TIGR00027 family)